MHTELPEVPHTSFVTAARYVDWQKVRHISVRRLLAGVNLWRAFPTIVNFSIFKAPLCGVKDHLFTFCDSSLSLIIHLSDLFVALGRSFFFTCMIFPLMESISLPLLPPLLSALSLLSTFLSHFLCFQLRTLVSLGALLTFSPPGLLLPYAHINVRRLIRCAGGLEFHSDLLPTLLLFLWVIHPSFLCPESQTHPLHRKNSTKKPCGLIWETRRPCRHCTGPRRRERERCSPGKTATGLRCVCV